MSKKTCVVPADADTDTHLSMEISATRGEVAPPTRSSTLRPHSRREAEVEDIVHTLRGYRVLTRARLREVCGATHWSDAGFKQALADAVSTGRIRQLGDDLYEISEPSIA
jgi:hypothetical protein